MLPRAYYGVPAGGWTSIHFQTASLCLRRSLPRGGGDTSIRIDIGKADFPLLWQSMTEADQTATLRAMLGELKRRDRVLRRRKEIARMAQDAGFKGQGA